MDFIDEVRTRSGRFTGRVKHLSNEEVTEKQPKPHSFYPLFRCWVTTSSTPPK